MNQPQDHQMQDTSGITPEQRRRADRLGLVLGGVAIVVLLTSFIVFTVAGLPKDAKEAKRLELRDAARRSMPDPGQTPNRP